jgi:hypothetical protein
MCGIWWKTPDWYSSKVKPVEERTEQTLDSDTGALMLRPFDLEIGPSEGEDSGGEEDAVRVEPEIWGDVEGVQIGEEEVKEGDEGDEDEA